jgi:diguanylate cyclase (GGDEF)-like protein
MSNEHNGILIVDDTPGALKLLADLLSAEGYAVRPANHGQLALRSAAARPPELILLDIRMPDMDGFAVCQRLKADERLKAIPVIFISAAAEMEDKIQAFQAGGVDYITKPYQAEEVLARVRTHLELHRSRLELKRLNEALTEANQQLQRIAETDGLLGIANRRYFDQRLEIEWQRAQREQTPLALLMIDVDYFKNYNDCLGHLAGDACLRQIAQVVATAPQRATDFVARYGGEELVVLLPNTTLEGAQIVAQFIRQGVAKKQLVHPSALMNYVTVSIGGAMSLPTSEGSPRDLIAAADQALYAAKADGRDRVCFA